MSYEEYKRLSDWAIERGRDRMTAAQPELGRDYCYHLVLNWGNPAARREHAKATKLIHYLYLRDSREFRLREHRGHLVPVWHCDQCQGRKARYRV